MTMVNYDTYYILFFLSVLSTTRARALQYCPVHPMYVSREARTKACAKSLKTPCGTSDSKMVSAIVPGAAV